MFVLLQCRNNAVGYRDVPAEGLLWSSFDGRGAFDEHKREFDMRLGKYLTAVAAATMAVAPAMAAPASPAASLSVSKSVRAGSTSAKKNELAGGGIIVAVVAAAAVIAGIVIVADSDDTPDSP